MNRIEQVKLWFAQLAAAALLQRPIHLANSFRKDRRGISGVQIMTAVIGIVVAITVVVNLLPAAMVDMSNETIWEGADPAVVSLLTLVIPIVIVASLIMLFMKIRK